MSEGKLLNSSIAKAFQVLDCFTPENPELGVSEIARHLSVNKSTVYRLLATLQNINILEQNESNQKYRLGLKLYSIGHKVELYQTFVLKARPILEEIAFKYKETVHLGIFDRDEVFYLDKVQGSLGLQINTQIGSYRPLHCTGIGKLILAHLSEEKRKSILKKVRIAKTENTIIEETQLKEALKMIRKQGYSLDNEEYEIGLICLAIPIYDRLGKFVGGVSLSGPSARFPFENLENYAKELNQYVLKIGQLINMN